MPPASDTGSSLVLLVVSTESRRVLAVRQAVAGWPVAAHVTGVAGVLSAVRTVLARTPDLVVVDRALETPGGRALVQIFARLQPGMPVLCFTDAAGSGLGADAPVHAWPWSELGVVLDRWLHPRL